MQVPIDLIDDNPYQTRATYDPAAIDELAADIRQNGLLQPPVVRGVAGQNRFQLAFGHRRLRAWRQLHAAGDVVAEMPCEVLKLSDEQMALFAWSENAKRKDLNPVEEARAIERMAKGFSWTQDTVGEKLGLNRSTVANKLRLLRLPAEVLDRLAAGELSERQAAALLPMYDLPATCLKAYERENGYGRKPADIVARSHQYSSDMLRDDVERIVQAATAAIPNQWFGYTFDDPHVKAPTCNVCEFRIKRDGAYRCTSKTCNERKQKLWEGARLAAAAIVTGIPVAPAELSYKQYSAMTSVPHPEQVLTKGCPNLRLRYNIYPGATVLHPTGGEYDDIEVICLHGEGNRCTCGSAAKAAATRADPDIQAQKAEQKRIQAEIIEPTAAAIVAALQANDRNVWAAMATRMWGTSARNDDDLPTLQRKIANALAETHDYDVKDKGNFDQWKAVREQRLVEIGLPIPWATSDLEKLQRRHERVAGWVDGRQWWRYDYEINLDAVQGNIANLEALIADIIALANQAETLPLLTQAQDALAILRKVADIAPAINEKSDWGRLGKRQTSEVLLTEPVGSLNFDQALEKATPALLQYAFDLAGSLERIQVLNDRLMDLSQVAIPTL
jgi:ParB/RepB/Spo0J family partition protein